MSLEEQALLARAQAGDVQAFERLVAAYERKVYNLAYRLTGNHDDASDVAQEALIKVYTSLGDFRGDSSFSTWLYRVVSNACLDELRRRKRQRATSLDEPLATDDGALARQLAASGDGPEEALARKELRATVQLAIQNLDEEHRVVIILRDIQGHSYQEIADYLGLSLGTVKSRLNRARAALQKKFSELELFGPNFVRRVQGR